MTDLSTRLLEVARERFGYESLLPGQSDAMNAVVAGRDVLVLMPTGAGKSAIYQIPALLLEGPTVVISPLIALQRDQVEALTETGTADAAHANSTQNKAERAETFERLRSGSLEYLFLAPEQLANEETFRELQATPPSLVVVDEAHCISAWGHDFRPEYLKLRQSIEQLGHPPVLALTATASPVVREEIIEHLGMRDPVVVARGFDRPNLHLTVRRFSDERSKENALLKAVREATSPGIVYVATRARAEDLAGKLWQEGVEAVYYHGGMTRAEREEAQAAFMDDRFDVAVATTAFGMGIDKADVRFVFHYDIPDSIDSLYQEIGRAGRDGKPAEIVLFYRSEDLGIRRFFAGNGHEGENAERRRVLDRSRIDMIRAYAETRDCRRQFLLNYFGEPFQDPCDNCDNCEAGSIVLDAVQVPFELNSRVEHASWGPGLVMRYEGDKIVVLFDSVGYKTLSVETVTEKGLLAPAT
ncbi:MAG: RecQ family ATP-dependent DNA helicase [Actinomycetota bacterium]